MSDKLPEKKNSSYSWASLERMAESEKNFRVQARSMPCKSGAPINLAEVRVYLMTLSETLVVKGRVGTWWRGVCGHGVQELMGFWTVIFGVQAVFLGCIYLTLQKTSVCSCHPFQNGLWVRIRHQAPPF